MALFSCGLGGATERSKLLELLENPPLHLIGTPSGRWMKPLRSHVLCNAEASRLEDLILSTARGRSFMPEASLDIIGDAGLVDSP